jgi:hypothetical protein
VAPGEPYYDLKNDPLGMKPVVIVTPQVYDLNSDPEEQKDVAPQQQEMVERIKPRLKKQWDTALAIREVLTQGVKPAELEDTLEKLEQLVQQGYISVADFERRKQVLEMKQFQDGTGPQGTREAAAGRRQDRTTPRRVGFEALNPTRDVGVAYIGAFVTRSSGGDLA